MNQIKPFNLICIQSLNQDSINS